MTVSVDMDSKTKEEIHLLAKTVRQDLLKRKNKKQSLSFKEAKKWPEFAELLHIYMYGINHKVFDEEIKNNGEKIKLRHYIAATFIDFLEIAPKEDNNIKLLSDETNRLVNRTVERKHHRWESTKKGPGHTPTKNQLSSDLSYVVLCRVVFEDEDAEELYGIITDKNNRRICADNNTTLQDICFEADFSYSAFQTLPGYIQEELIRNTKRKADNNTLLPLHSFLNQENKIISFFTQAKAKEIDPIYSFWFNQAMDKTVFIDGNISEGLRELEFLKSCNELQFDNAIRRYMKPGNFYSNGYDVNDVYNNYLRKLSLLMTENKSTYSKHIVMLEDTATYLKDVVAYDMITEIKTISAISSKGYYR